MMVSTWIAGAKAWVLERLPALNRSAYGGHMTDGELACLVNEVLRGAPPPRDLGGRQAMQALMLLGVCGSSVERHAQQARRRAGEPASPGHGLDKLLAAGRPFVEYFAELADRLGHAHRDSFVTFVEHNGPAVCILHPERRELLHVVPAAFEDGAYITFTARPEELEFIRLLKECAGLQGAANLFLERLQDPATALDGPDAVSAGLHAATLMLAIRAKLVEFMRQSAFDADFFLDVLRQYACHWSARTPLRPPSGANDDTSLHRDVMLFHELLPASGDFPGYNVHVEHVCSVLMPAAVQTLAAAMASPSIEARLLARLGTTRDALGRLDAPACEALLDAHPWVAALLAVYDAQRDLSRAHYGTVTRYLTGPKHHRDACADPRERFTVVPNTHGTTGMDPLRIVRALDEARANHPLAAVGARAPRARLADVLQRLGHRPWRHGELLGLVAPPGGVGAGS
jgi:hypothetical protein